jgi:hypothetical protein
VHVSRSRALLLVAVVGLAGALSAAAVLAPQQAEANRSSARQASVVKHATVIRHASKARRIMVVAQLQQTLGGIHAARDRAWRWQDVMSTPRSRYVASAEHSPSLAYRRMVLGLWTTRAQAVQRTAQNPPRLKEWLCIHRYEGAWNDPNAPYYGGLQMDWSFMQAYGPTLLRHKGTADHWTPLEQIWVAERAFESGRGFYPWPNTARWCGLI